MTRPSAEVWQWAGHGDQVQAAAWSPQGASLATQSKDKTLRVFDPRYTLLYSSLEICIYNDVHSRSSSGPVQETASHAGMKDSKVVWVGEGRVLTSGFGADRARELIIRDTRNISSPQKVLSLDVSSGILMPLHDPDTNMVFLCGKGDR